MRLPLLPSSLLGLGLLAYAAETRAETAPPIDLTYEATRGASCPSAEAFRASVDKRLSGARAAAGVAAHVAIDVRARARGDAARAKVFVTKANGSAAERSVAGRSCAEVAEASALLVALFAEGDTSQSAEPDGETASSDPAAAPSAETVTPPPSPSSADAMTPAPARETPRTDAPPANVEPKRFAVEANPLSLVVSRFSAQVEWLPARHSALTLNPFYFHANRTETVDGQAYDLGSQNGVGAELGYRYYTGTRGPNGFFVGPSLVLANFWASGGETTPPTAIVLTRPDSYTAYGAAVDLGGQFVLGPGVVMGFGVGAQYLFTSKPPADLSILFEGRAGFSPRVLASLGYAF
jgi:hypothetical protein